jgi:arylsulfatase A-like enzyme
LLRKLLDSRWTYVVLAAALGLAALVSQLEFTGPQPKGDVSDLLRLRERDDVNVLFIVIDTLRADHLSSYGYERSTSPNLDALAAAGVRFASVESQSSWTKASMASLWMGAYPERTGVTRYDHAIPEAARLPAEILREAGFVTAGIWRNGWLAENFGFARGFDIYERPVPSQTPERMERRTPSSHPLLGIDLDATEAALEFLRSRSHERFFLYVHYMDVHQYLYDETSARFGVAYLDAYDNAIHWVDRNVAILVNALAERELLDRTLVVVVSDHGEAFFEHGSEGHARNLYREVAETPWIMLLPFRLEPGIVVPQTVRNIDVWPTLLDLLGLPAIPGAEGRSVLPLMLAAGGVAELPADWDGAAFGQLDQTWGRAQGPPRPIASVREGPYRLIQRVGEDAPAELFDRRSDPGELYDIASERPEEVGELRPPCPWGEAPEVEVDQLRLMQLRALGYVVDE